MEREKFVIHVQTESKLEYIKTKQKPLLQTLFLINKPDAVYEFINMKLEVEL